jgi:Zn-dependent M28 family amino/carboxypeptidase
MFTKMLYILLATAMISCSQSKNPSPETAEVPQTVKQSSAPAFDADSAWLYVDTQVKFGPRVPNTEAHVACGNYLAGELKRFGAKVYEQEATLTAYNNTQLRSKNIIGSYNPDNTKRILLFAHWDSRPYSDHDQGSSQSHKKAIDGADDGASGVGVLLEIARQFSALRLASVGMDIIFFRCGRLRHSRICKGV